MLSFLTGLKARSLALLLAAVPLLLVTVASLPALMVLPFIPRAARRAETIVVRLASWSRDLCSGWEGKDVSRAEHTIRQGKAS